MKIHYLLIILLLLFFGCNNKKKSVTLVIKGSETISYILKQTQQMFQAKYPEYKLVFVGGGSHRGLASIIDQTTDIAISNVPFSFDEKNQLKRLHLNPKLVHIAENEIYFIVHEKNELVTISLSQLREILSGKILKWNFELTDEFVAKKEPEIIEEHPAIQENEFILSENIIITSRQKSSGNYYWLSHKVLQDQNLFHQKKQHDFIDDFELIQYFKEQGKYAIGAISIPTSMLPPKIVRIVITDDINYKQTVSKNGVPQPYPEFKLKTDIYLIVPDVNEKVKPFIDFICSADVKHFLRKNQMTPLSCKITSVIPE